MAKREPDLAFIQDQILQMMHELDPNPTRSGIAETPKRVAHAWLEWTKGYDVEPGELLKEFEDGAEGCGDEMVVVKDIRFYSQCEHHLAPFFGVAHVAYIPDKKIVGLSKLARVVDAFARRFQVQERITNQVADLLFEKLNPKGVGVVIEARHLCMESRGINKPGATTVTSALRGRIKEDAASRAELMTLIGRVPL